MDNELLIRLTWRGRKTIAAIPGLLNRAEQIEIALPDNYNHALFRALNPEAPASAVEELNVSAGPELLADVATVSGLEAFATLTDILSAAGASIQITSPPTLVISVSPANQAKP